MTSHSFALVNLKPLLPGHVLVSPLRRVPRLSDLNADEVSDLFLTVQRVGRMIERVFKSTALNVAIQDGEAAGQTVPHVHAHIIPRRNGDLDQRGGNDAIYDMLEGEEGDMSKIMQEVVSKNNKNSNRRTGSFPSVDNESRKPRSNEELSQEAEWLASEMEKEPASAA